jgi:hypothetical protein
VVDGHLIYLLSGALPRIYLIFFIVSFVFRYTEKDWLDFVMHLAWLWPYFLCYFNVPFGATDWKLSPELYVPLHSTLAVE